MTLINLTPHALDFWEDGVFVFSLPPSGQVARIEELDLESQHTADHGEHILIVNPVELGEPVGLPPVQPGVFCVVSRPFLYALHASGRNRFDLVVPGPAVRDEKGRQIGCIGLNSIPPLMEDEEY